MRVLCLTALLGLVACTTPSAQVQGDSVPYHLRGKIADIIEAAQTEANTQVFPCALFLPSSGRRTMSYFELRTHADDLSGTHPVQMFSLHCAGGDEGMGAGQQSLERGLKKIGQNLAALKKTLTVFGGEMAVSAFLSQHLPETYDTMLPRVIGCRTGSVAISADKAIVGEYELGTKLLTNDADETRDTALSLVRSSPNAYEMRTVSPTDRMFYVVYADHGLRDVPVAIAHISLSCR